MSPDDMNVALLTLHMIGRPRILMQRGSMRIGRSARRHQRPMMIKPSCSAKSSKSLTLSVANGNP